MSWPAIVLWILIVPAVASSGPVLIYLVMVTGVFMSLQMLPGDAAGANLLPQTVYACALICKVAVAPGNLLRGLELMLDPRRLGLFTAFVVFGIVTAIALPRVFGGLVEVIPVSGAALTGSSLLEPRSGNITQTGYMLISYLTAVAFAIIGSRRDVRDCYLTALVVGAMALIATGIIDLALYKAGLSQLLDPFRTASYTLLTDVEAAGAKRVVGLTPEASTYGTLCVNAAVVIFFLRPLYPKGRSRALATAAFVGTVVMAALSTSATAYIGGAVFACVYLFDLMRRLLNPKAAGRDTLRWEIGLMLVVAVIGIGILALTPGVLSPAFDVVNKIIFQKTSSLSFEQRSMWTRVGWQAFLDSGGLGVGLGSVRTSNWEVSILGSTGIFGAVLIFGFFLQKLLMPTSNLPRGDASFARALKLSLLPFFAMNSLGGTIPDIGVGAAAILGFLSSAGMMARPEPKAAGETTSAAMVDRPVSTGRPS
ncbi:MAG: hypothetical protein P4L82_06440 [Ancalomicrobiaceae bacterium]|nr:hypothetical protein [Ancalomicrobiaceae bacterium]